MLIQYGCTPSASLAALARTPKPRPASDERLISGIAAKLQCLESGGGGVTSTAGAGPKASGKETGSAAASIVASSAGGLTA
jgi:hypothetical protein